MSLNKLTDTNIKQWMDIGCDEIKCNTFETDTLITDSLTIIRNEATPTYITMTNEALPPNQRTYGFYSSVSNDAFYISQFNDVPAVSKNYLLLSGTGGIVVPTENLTITSGNATITSGTLTLSNGTLILSTAGTAMTANGNVEIAGNLDLKSTGSLLNVPSSTSAGSFYHVFTSSGNVFAGAIPATALEYKASRVGGVITIDLPNLVVAETASATITASVVLPTDMRPNSAKNCIMISEDNGAISAGIVNVGTGGLLTFYPTINFGNYSGLGNGGFLRCSVVYSIP